MRLLILCRRPYHLGPGEAEAWLGEQLEDVIRRDGLDAASLTGLEHAREDAPREWDWLIEFEVDDEARAAALEAGGACGELLADMRLLGMSPTAALAADPKTIDERPS